MSKVDTSDAEAKSTNGCWVKVYEHVNFEGESIVFHGPEEVRNCSTWKWPDGGTLGDDIGSLVTGPNAWFIGYEDENFEDKRVHVGPDTQVRDLNHVVDGMNDNIDSYKLYATRPPEWP